MQLISAFRKKNTYKHYIMTGIDYFQASFATSSTNLFSIYLGSTQRKKCKRRLKDTLSK